MVTKTKDVLGIALLSFVISYLLSSALNKDGIDTTTMINSVLIVISTLLIITVINRVFSSNQKPKNN